jgi:hypothetical protein
MTPGHLEKLRPLLLLSTPAPGATFSRTPVFRQGRRDRHLERLDLGTVNFQPALYPSGKLRCSIITPASPATDRELHVDRVLEAVEGGDVREWNELLVVLAGFD